MCVGVKENCAGDKAMTQSTPGQSPLCPGFQGSKHIVIKNLLIYVNILNYVYIRHKFSKLETCSLTESIIARCASAKHIGDSYSQ